METLINKHSLSYFPNELWVSEYNDSFKDIIKQKETIKIPFMHASPQLEYRLGIVNHLRKVCIEKKLSHCSLHLAIYLIDLFMDCHRIVPDKLLLLANVCLLLAAKFEESFSNIPKISEINATVQHRYTKREYRDLEVLVLDYFSWYIKFPTVAHYTHYYLQNAITPEELTGRSENMRTMIYQVHDNILEYLNQIVSNIHYMQEFKPSMLAAAVIAASKIDCGLTDWSDDLRRLTDYSKEDIHDLVYTLYINKYGRNIDPLISCTFTDNFCHICNIKSCPDCFFLKKM